MHIGEVMESISKIVTVSDNLNYALEIMRADGLEAIPVVGHDGEVVGLVWRSSIQEMSTEDSLDEALKETFPASDPISPA